MNKVSLKKIRHLQLGGNIWQTLGNQQLQGATGGFGQYLYNQTINPITPPYNSVLYPNPIASQGSLNSTPLNTNFSPQVQQQFQKQQESQTQANINQYRQKQLAKKQSAAKIGGMIGTAADMISGVLPINAVYNGSEGQLAHGFDLLGKSASDMIMKVNPMVGGSMKVAMALGQGLSAIGLGTDGMTKQDAILNSNLMNVTPLGMINAAFGKRSHQFTINQDTIKSVGSDYDDTVGDIYDTKRKANKKYGLFSTHARHKANRFIDATNAKQNTMTDISNNARRILAQSSDANALRFNMAQNGGINQQYLRIAKLGTKLPKIKEKIEWQPVITIDDPIKLEKGGNVTIQVTVVKEPKEEPKEEAKNVIPAGALHANKHHMDNADSLTQKGIPVVNDKGEQQAEIEKDEIILHLKLTNKLEELQEKYEKASKTEQDKLAIEAGKLLVEEILYNTIDNTNLIDKCEKGGKINGSI